MFMEIKTSGGRTVFVNPQNIVSAELNVVTYSWKILMVRELAYDTEEFDTKNAAMNWFEEALR